MPERTPYIAANWKMHKTVAEAAEFVDALLPRIAATQNDVVICPPFTALTAVVERRYGTAVKVAAQNMHEEDSGAFTGEVSAPMLVELDVEAVVLGHSERRQFFGETDEALARKVPAALAAGLEPILCVGESEEARDARPDRGACWSASCRPTWPAVERPSWPRSSIAYEPIWAIGTGRTATPEQAQEACAFIRDVLRERGAAADAVRILYGGSVKPANAAELLAQPDIDGALVGGASLDPDEFAAIVEAAWLALARTAAFPRWRWSSSTAGGCAEPGPGNAISLAETPVFDRLWARYPHTQLSAQGRDVGLPDGQMGNSEVGHLNLGAGAIVKQDLARIDDAIADGSFFENEALLAACDARPPQPARPPAPARPRLRRRRPLRLGAHRGDDRARLPGGRPRRRLPRLHRRPRHAAPRRPRVPRRARALAAPGGPRRHRQRPLLRDGPRHALGADQARLRRDRPRPGPARGELPPRRSTPPTSARRPTSSSSRP